MGWYSGNRREEVKRHIGPWDSVEGGLVEPGWICLPAPLIRKVGELYT